MSDSKEFLGKTLDAAIAEACSYYDVPREKLEIEIIEDAKTGIFGIVGARKAKIRAKLASLPDFMQKMTSPAPAAERAERQEGHRRTRSERRREKNDGVDQLKEEPVKHTEEIREKNQDKSGLLPVLQDEPRLPAVRKSALPAPLSDSGEERRDDMVCCGTDDAEDLHEEGSRQPRGRQTKGRRKEAVKNDDAEMDSALPRIPLAELDQEKLIQSTREILSRLIAPVLDSNPEDVDLSIEVGEDRIQVSIKSEDTGLLIGRDGQNLAAVQYLASRMITRAMGAQIRLQVDAGDYHVRQDVRLQELALALAEKVKATGKVQTTRPLSAYQRRVIHLALQDDPEVQTRSSGDGPLKHVVILRRKD